MSPKFRVVLASIIAFVFLSSTSFVGYKLWHNNFNKNQKVLGSQTTNSQTNDISMQALGYSRLSANEFAITKRIHGSGEKKDLQSSIQLSTGQTLTFPMEGDKTDIEILEGNLGSQMYIKSDSNTTIHTYDELDDRSGKVDTGIRRKLKKDATTSVVIQMNLPFNRFYEKGQSESKRAEKQKNFDEIKQKILGLISNGGKAELDLPIINGFSAQVDTMAVDALEKSPLVKKVELEREVKAAIDTSVDEIGARSVWQLFSSNNNSLTGVGETIGVIDTGVDYTHPDLGGCIGANCKVIGGYDCVNNDNNPMDDMGHGTHVAATAAGKGFAANGQQLYGVAPDAKIMAYKVLNSSGSGSTSTVLCGMNRAVADRVNVATMSLGGTGNPDDSLSLAADNGAAAGVVFTIAAGNSGPTASTIGSPGTARTAITVAAACKTAQIGTLSYCAQPIAYFSSRGPLVWNGVDIKKPDISAPGVLICAARWGTAFATSPTCFDTSHIRISGTSMATPHMAGAAALVLQAYPGYTPEQVKQLLKSTAKNLGMTYNDQGAGEINLKAAIPLSPKLSITPNSWIVTSDPTKKTNSFTQNFSITPLTTDTSNLNISFQSNPAGVTLTANKNTLSVANKTTDSFQTTLALDNDVVKSGQYFINIVLSENGVTKGTIPIYLQVKSTITVTPEITVDYGVDDPSLSAWTSPIKTLTVKNLRSDTPQNITIASQPFSPATTGVVFQSPTQMAIPSGGTVNIDTQISVNNSTVANNVYMSTLQISNNVGTIAVPLKFVKYYALIVQDANTSDFSAADVFVHNQGNVIYRDFGSDSPKTFYLNSKGTYDVIVRYSPLYINNEWHDYTVFKENVSVNSGITSVTVSRSDAKNLVKTVATDPNGTIRYPLSTRYTLHWFVSTTYGTWWTSSGTMTYPESDTASNYYSDISNKYKIVSLQSWPSFGSAEEIYYFNAEFNGLSANKTFSNTAADFKRLDIQVNPDQLTGTIQPNVWSCLSLSPYVSVCSLFGSIYKTLTLPVTQRLYSLRPPTDFFYHVYNDIASPNFTIDNPSQRFITKTEPRIYLPPITDAKIYNGLGPSYWAAKLLMTNSITLDIYPYFVQPWVIGTAAQFGFANAIFRQDFGLKSYPSIPFSIYQNNNGVYTLIASSSLDAYTAGSRATYSYLDRVLFTSSNVPPYQLRLEFPYKNAGIDLVGKVIIDFYKSATDPNPPAFKRLYYYSNGARSEVYDPTKSNLLEFEMDPIGGTMGEVTVKYSSDSGTMTPAAIALNNGVYTASIPSVSGLTKMAIQIKGTDSSGNSLSYTFELPFGTAPPAPTGSPTPTPATKPGDANGDKIVDEKDYAIWLANFNQTTSGGVTVGDFNGDGKVDGIDYAIWLNNYGK